MTDPLDDRLTSAGRVLNEDPEVSSALHALGNARAADAHNTRRRRFLFPSIAIGAVLAFFGAGAVAATQWLPWTTVDPDIIVSRDWTDVSGTYLGSCESRMATEDLSADAREDVRSYLDSLDVDSIAPNPEIIASELASVGRSDDLGRLIPGAVAVDFDTSHVGEFPSPEWRSDARILQDGLMDEVLTRMVKHLESGAEYEGVIAGGETQCTTDPARTADK